MKFDDLYRETFSRLHSSKEIRWEDFAQMKAKRRPLRQLTVLAAVIALLAALSAAAVAMDFFGLRQVLLPQQGKVNVLDENGIVVPGETEYRDFISLAGFSDTPETRALGEWQEFLDGYDQDGTIIARIGNNPTGFEEEYGLYQVYTQEMADKIDEITAKYGLHLHRAMGMIFPGEWESRIGPFFQRGVTPYTGYAYEDGTFAFDGGANLPDYGPVDYQFRRSVRGAFETVTLNIGDVSQYETWGYETACGVPVTLALGSEKALILADLEDCFVTLNVLAGTETSPDDVFSSGPFHKEDLEALADAFDFTVLTPVSPLDVENFSETPPEEYDVSNIPLTEGEPETEGDPSEQSILLHDMTGMEEAPAREFARHFISLVDSGYRESAAEMIAYPCMVAIGNDVVTAHDQEELCGYFDDIFTPAVMNRLLPWLDEEDPGFIMNGGLAGVADGALWFGLAEDGDIRVFTVQDEAGNGIYRDAPAQETE